MVAGVDEDDGLVLILVAENLKFFGVLALYDQALSIKGFKW